MRFCPQESEPGPSNAVEAKPARKEAHHILQVSATFENWRNRAVHSAHQAYNELSGTVLLQVNTHQMVILMRFNHRNRFSFKELLVRLLVV